MTARVTIAAATQLGREAVRFAERNPFSDCKGEAERRLNVAFAAGYAEQWKANASHYRGAPMGRIPAACDSPDMAARIYASRVRINSGGYESGTGVYWGIGQPLYRVEQGGCEDWIRARSRADAIEQFKESDQ